MNRPPRDFLNWLKEQELIGSYHQIEKTTKKSDIYTVMNHIQTKGEGIDLSNIYKSRSSDEDLYKLLDFGEMDEFAQANRLRLRPLPKQIIKKLKVGHLDFTEQYTGKLIIENCWIGDLSFRKGASMEIEIIDTWIGRIKLEPRLFRHATING